MILQIEVWVQAQRVPRGDVIRLLELLARALEGIKNGAEARTQLELALVKAAQPRVDASTQALLSRLEGLEAQVAGTVPAPAAAPPAPVPPAPAPFRPVAAAPPPPPAFACEKRLFARVSRRRLRCLCCPTGGRSGIETCTPWGRVRRVRCCTRGRCGRR